MFKKVIALSTAAMILLTPMSASAVSWGDVVSGLRTKGSYTDGKMTATIVWSSPNYDYMIVDGTKYLPSSTEGGSVFEIPVSAFDEPVSVIGDTVAMSKPHEIEYTLTFRSDTLQSVE